MLVSGPIMSKNQLSFQSLNSNLGQMNAQKIRTSLKQYDIRSRVFINNQSQISFAKREKLSQKTHYPYFITTKKSQNYVEFAIKRYRGSFISDLKQSDHSTKIAFLIEILESYRFLTLNYGAFKINSQKIRTCKQKQFVIWINQDYWEFQKSQIISGESTQKIMVQSFIQMVEQMFFKNFFRAKPINSLVQLEQYLKFVQRRNQIHKKCNKIIKEKKRMSHSVNLTRIKKSKCINSPRLTFQRLQIQPVKFQSQKKLFCCTSLELIPFDRDNNSPSKTVLSISRQCNINKKKSSSKGTIETNSPYKNSLKMYKSRTLIQNPRNSKGSNSSKNHSQFETNYTKEISRKNPSYMDIGFQKKRPHQRSTTFGSKFIKSNDSMNNNCRRSENWPNQNMQGNSNSNFKKKESFDLTPVDEILLLLDDQPEPPSSKNPTKDSLELQFNSLFLSQIEQNKEASQSSSKLRTQQEAMEQFSRILFS